MHCDTLYANVLAKTQIEHSDVFSKDLRLMLESFLFWLCLLHNVCAKLLQRPGRCRKNSTDLDGSIWRLPYLIESGMSPLKRTFSR